MAGIDDLFKGNIATGLAIGIGAAILTPVIVPLISSVGKPLAKSAIKAGILVFEKSRETFAELGEVMDDLIAEAKVELETGPLATGGAVVATQEAVETATKATEEVETGNAA
jgi:hypothetical protein